MPYMTFLTKCLHVTIVLISASQTARKDGLNEKWTANFPDETSIEIFPVNKAKLWETTHMKPQQRK